MNTERQFTEELQLAEAAAREAGSIIMALFGKDYRIEQKGKNNPVTTADLEANRRIREIILGRYPEDAWLSEEDRDNLRRLNSRRVWVVDPIDGTREFIEGVPQFAVSIGLVLEGRSVLGVVYNPAEDQLYLAARGSGAQLNGQSVEVSSRKEVQGARLLVSRSEPRRKFQPFAELCSVEPVGSIAYRLAMVAGGGGDGTLTFRSLREWDVCAGTLIVEEAGGVVTDGRGKALVFNREDPVFNGIVASNRMLSPVLQSMWLESMAQK
ncbi:MAG: 3'(2'),5'-bisphosphate nucleotidase CysQ [Deltaproteobacteria bacterium]|nr:3'(2'),5'-bisphosphate nucleotidase CysQ [Deltaproteobacteria bacterium]